MFARFGLFLKKIKLKSCLVIFDELYEFMKIQNVFDEYINALALLDNGRALDISQLTSLIKDSSFVVANDTGPAHIAAHVGVKGLTLFGKHTTAYKVSIEREKFKPIQVSDLSKLSAEKVLEKINLA